MRKFKLVFFVQDLNAPKTEYDRYPNILGGESAEAPFGEMKQMIIEASEAELVIADLADADKIQQGLDVLQASAGHQGYDNAVTVNYLVNGRDKYVREITEAAGLIIGKILRYELAHRFGAPRYREWATKNGISAPWSNANSTAAAIQPDVDLQQARPGAGESQ